MGKKKIFDRKNFGKVFRGGERGNLAAASVGSGKGSAGSQGERAKVSYPKEEKAKLMTCQAQVLEGIARVQGRQHGGENPRISL